MKKSFKIGILVFCILSIVFSIVFYMSHRNGEFRVNNDKHIVEYYYLNRVKAKDADITIKNNKYIIKNYALIKINGKDSGFIKVNNGKKYYIVNGKTYDGLLDKKLYKNGLFEAKANGKIKVDKNEYLFKDGVLFNGLFEKEFYVDGLVEKNKNGFFEVNGIEYLFKNGKLYTGLNEKKYFVNGLLDVKKTGFYEVNGKKLYFDNGKLFTGLLDKKYYENGVFISDKKGEIKYKNTVYYVENGLLYSGFTNNKMYVEGVPDKNYNGYKILDNIEYYFSEGVVTRPPDDVPVKILLVGNSYTYYQGMGQMLSAFIKDGGKSALVVRATKGGHGLASIMKNDLQYVAFLDGKQIEDGSKTKLDVVVNKDFANLNRPARWDYIMCQNNEGISKLHNTNIEFFNKYLKCVNDKSQILFHATYYSNSPSTSRRNAINQVAEECGCSVINSSFYYREYNSYFKRNWISDLTVQDNPKHPSSRGAYLMALCIYCKIYGTREFAKSNDDSNFIQVYNSDSGYTNEFAPNKFKRKKHTTNYSMKVTKSDAKKLQTFVSKYANDYLGSPLDELK